MELFKLLGKIALDNSEAIEGTNEAVDVASEASEKFGSALETIGDVAKKTAIVVGTAFTAAASGVVMLTKSAVSNYAEFEQLYQGAELLFGKGYDYITEHAKNAYATVQMSQSEYLTQVNGFAVGLKNALGGDEEAAAELADRIVVAEADIVAATGATSESVQNAFNGIMKNNYTMVDNLQLGIAPTKEGFQAMIDSVNEYNKAHGNMTNYTIENLADCQNALVDYVAMQGMAGYAMSEGNSTISGSLSTLKASWMNLITGLADPNADLGQMIDGMVKSAKNALVTLKPAILNALSGIGTLVKEIVPIISEEIPTLIDELLPPLLDACSSLIEGVVQALPQLVTVLSTQLPTILSQIFNTLNEIMPELMVAVVGLIVAIADILATPEYIQMLLDCMGAICTALADAFLTEENIQAFIQRIADLISGIVTYFAEHGYEIGEAFVNAMSTMWGGLEESDIATNILNWIGGLSVGIISLLSALSGNTEQETENIINTLGELGNGMKNKLMLGYQAVSGAISMLWGYLVTGWNGVKGAISNIWSDITTGWDAFKLGFETIAEAIADAIDAFIGLFDFEITFPSVKLPHFSVSGGSFPWGVGGEGSLPSVSVEYYAKGGILSNPTAFGMNGNNLMVGGEAGREAIIPLDKNTSGIELIAQRLQANMDNGSNANIEYLLQNILNRLDDISNMKIVMDSGETVGALTPSINSALGTMSTASDRGGRLTWT